MEKLGILIVGMSHNVGGAEKRLEKILSMLVFNMYDVDSLLFKREAKF